MEAILLMGGSALITCLTCNNKSNSNWNWVDDFCIESYLLKSPSYRKKIVFDDDDDDNDEQYEEKEKCLERFCSEPNKTWRQCYIRQAKLNHPDRGGDKSTMEELNNCNELLND